MLPVSGLIHGEFQAITATKNWRKKRDSQVILNISQSTSPEVMAEKSSMLRESCSGEEAATQVPSILRPSQENSLSFEGKRSQISLLSGSFPTALQTGIPTTPSEFCKIKGWSGLRRFNLFGEPPRTSFMVLLDMQIYGIFKSFVTNGRLTASSWAQWRSRLSSHVSKLNLM